MKLPENFILILKTFQNAATSVLAFLLAITTVLVPSNAKKNNRWLKIGNKINVLIQKLNKIGI